MKLRCVVIIILLTFLSTATAEENIAFDKPVSCNHQDDGWGFAQKIVDGISDTGLIPFIPTGSSNGKQKRTISHER